MDRTQSARIRDKVVDNIVEETIAGVPGFLKEYSGWDVYNNEAKKVDTELVKDWTASLNFLLLFAAIFAAVLTAFIIESKKLLEQDPLDIMAEVMILYTNNAANGTLTTYTRPKFEPKTTDLTVNCLFFASLSASLIAALASVVALQWVADYDAAITRGGSSPEDRAKRRQFRFAGVVSWKMSEIIAALPLILHFSVALFFAGLAVWMWSIHYIVGFVVIGGAGMAILFYGCSTLIAVAFVSAPFRTPLTRWIYALFHLPFFLVYWASNALSAPRIPVWLQKLHNTYTLSHKREDLAVEIGGMLKSEAIAWLANQISVSQDSYSRLLLVVAELPTIIPEHLSLPKFMEAPWDLIFDLLGWKNLKDSEDQQITEDDIRAMEILAQCYKITKVREMVQPSITTLYTSDYMKGSYWSQHYTRSDTVWAPKSQAQSNIPNSLFLLLRDVPLPESHATSQIVPSISLSRWRNSQRKNPNVWKEVMDLEDLPDAFFDSSVVTFGHFVLSNAIFLVKDDEWSTYMDILARMVHLLVSSSVKGSDSSIRLLLRTFECLLTGTSQRESSQLVSVPLEYCRRLHYSSNLAHALHYSFTLLMARQISAFSNAERHIRVKEIIGMHWLRPLYPIIRDWKGLKLVAGLGYGKFNLDLPILRNWIEGSEVIPDLLEILQHMAIAQGEDPSIGPLWWFTSADPNFIEALIVIDKLISEEVTSEQHYMMITLLCQDLELSSQYELISYFTLERLRVVDKLVDPCLRLLASALAGLENVVYYVSYPDFMGSRKKSWRRIAEHLLSQYSRYISPAMLQLKASLWPQLAILDNDFVQQASREPRLLSHSQQVFMYAAPCRQHLDGPGHLLLHMFNPIPLCKFSSEVILLTGVSLRGRKLHVLLMLMLRPDALEAHQFPDLSRHFDANCMIQLTNMANIVRCSQSSLLGLLWDLSTKILRNRCAPEHFAAFITCINQAMKLQYDHQSTFIMLPLANRVMHMLDAMLSDNDYNLAEQNIVEIEVKKVWILLTSALASRVVFGGYNRRVLICARSQDSSCPAERWLPIHVN